MLRKGIDPVRDDLNKRIELPIYQRDSWLGVSFGFLGYRLEREVPCISNPYNADRAVFNFVRRGVPRHRATVRTN